MSVLTAQQICTLAAQIAKGPGFLSQAGQFLNQVLEDLVLNKNLKMNRVSTTITLPANTYGPVTLESDYLRTYDLFYPLPTSAGQGSTFGGVTQFLNPITMQQFDAEFKSPSTANYPYEFATDISPQSNGGNAQLYVYPQSSGIISLTHRYMLQRQPIANPESSSVVPWFQFTKFLVTQVAADLMAITGDDRRGEFMKDAMMQLQPHLIMEGDEQAAVHEISLDPRRFRTTRGVKSTKVYPF